MESLKMNVAATQLDLATNSATTTVDVNAIGEWKAISVTSVLQATGAYPMESRASVSHF